MRRIIRYVLIGLGALFLLIQLVPYGRDHENPPVTGEPDWDSPRTLELARTACFDCHSNETEWPWYSNIAPVSWLVYRDVVDGRESLNWSEWDRVQEEAGESAETVREGEMPPSIYTITHRDARLSDAEEADLIGGLEATFGTDEGGGD
jgi:hypothetical protein